MSVKKIKIYGAGSIGNHLANASRRLGHKVDICDIDAQALTRTKQDIYPMRYGKWDEDIGLYLSHEAPKKSYDLIIVGTPPDSHARLALEAIEEQPKAVLIEKPVCGPDLVQAQEIVDKANIANTRVFVGYDHVVGKAAELTMQHAKSDELGPLQTLDVEFREHWGGIFKAHPWLSGPWDTYLGFYKRGGGASGEHSHAINLWQHFAHEMGAGRVTEVTATMDMVDDGRVNYDKLCLLNLKTQNGLVGRCVQDVVTKPHRKWARLQFENGHVEWNCSVSNGHDKVVTQIADEDAQDFDISKTRPDDFVRELEYLHNCLDSNLDSALSIERGLDTMLVIAAAHLSHKTGRTIKIDYDQGYKPQALVES